MVIHMNDVIHAKLIADAKMREIDSLWSGASGTNHVGFFDWKMLSSSGSFQFVGIEPYITTGKQENIIILWKCQSCGNVHRLEDTLECTACGQPITEKSRFRLE